VCGKIRIDVILGKRRDWDHHKIETNIMRINQNIKGIVSQFSGLRCGIEIHFEKVS
jgi:hypothetical protein